MHTNSQERDRERTQQQESAIEELYTEARLASTSALAWLEDLAIIPLAKSPNPYNGETEIRQHDLWWLNHPSARDAYHAAIERRDSRLRHIKESLVRKLPLLLQ